MTAGEKLEQRLTGRPDSHVPGRTMQRLMKRSPSPTTRHPVTNHAMHWGTGALLGALRGVWAATGIRGGRASATHAVVRLAFDQTLENATGEGAPPHTWPARERALDVAHKGVYSLVTGMVADRWIRTRAVSTRGRTSG
jgi:hypothetical protein